jgi:N-acyl-D-aspartate/D-glutamate deacylase
VTPGFVDVHTHYDGQATWEHTLTPSSHHGVTTVVAGNCGVGFAPVREADRETLVKVMEGVEDIPEVVMTKGMPWNWETFPQYLDVLAGRAFDVDIAAQVPHSAVRVYVMGERALRHEPATEAERAAMRAIVLEGVRAGAIGVSTSRSINHRLKNGDMAPSVDAAAQELLALADALREAGAGVFQLIPHPDQDADEEMALIREVAAAAQRPLSFTVLQYNKRPEDWRKFLKGLEGADADGLPIRGQVYPRPVGLIMGLDLSLHGSRSCAIRRSGRGCWRRTPISRSTARSRPPKRWPTSTSWASR